jgi:hypothetical protein
VDNCASSTDLRNETGTGVVKGKENVMRDGGGGTRLERGVQGLLIFGKRDGRLIGREEVLAQFRMKREEYGRQGMVVGK